MSPSEIPGPSPSMAFREMPRSPRREAPVRPFEGFGVAFQWGLRRGFSAARFRWTVVLTVGFGALIGYLHSRGGDATWQAWMALDRALVGVVVPLVALALVGASFGEEVAEQTLVYHLVRPVSRATIFLARFCAGVLPAAAAAVTVVVVGTLTTGVSLPLLSYARIAVVAAVGAVSVGAVYYTLGSLFRWGLVWGLLYTTIVEGIFQFVTGSVQDFSLMHHVRSVLHRWTDADFSALSRRIARKVASTAADAPTSAEDLLLRRGREVWSTTEDALLFCAIAAAVALSIGAIAVKRRDFALKE